MSGEPLRDATPSERTQALTLAGLSRSQHVWVSDAADGSRTFIVCPGAAVNGVAVAVDREGQELWRKPAFYSELLRAGDGYELQYGSLRPTVRASWVASVKLPDGSSRSSDTLILMSEWQRNSPANWRSSTLPNRGTRPRPKTF
jgi:hypothetical protein